MKPNNEKIDLAIQVMKRVQKLEDELNRKLLDMNSFQSHYGVSYKTFNEAVGCGTTCCFAGWIAVSPEFPELIPDRVGVPISAGIGVGAPTSLLLGEIFGVDRSEAAALIFDQPDATVQDVIDTLESWKS